jgi:hypothetical protein
MLVEPDYPVDENLAAVLAAAGVRIGDGIAVDPSEHYFTDEQMIAVARYAAHPITRGLALSIYPGRGRSRPCRRPVRRGGTVRNERAELSAG